ncbi:N-acetylmuramoyl-L-alanine amidase [Halobacillus litoralis]|uniref:peptidoglycan recognition protein family protein n=1 Tax=Halobacillus litoralis TaxID=45668 RepID=UPI001CD1B493|nr:peptidoglycan recognition family protein [Halobacillus litoralis]MCA1021767.1 peptidoglycan recognition protein family protein [Halobacillus litoralis]
MTYSFESLDQLVNLRGKLPHDGWYNVYSEHYKTDIAIHHSLTDTGDSKAFAMYHVYTHEWPEIAYHFVILKDGTIEYNHQLGVLSYHVGNSNKQAVGICLVGDFRYSDPTSQQEKSLYELQQCLIRDLPNYQRTRGHDEFPGYAWKPCPEFDYESVIQGDLDPIIKWLSGNEGKQFTVIYDKSDEVNIYSKPDWGSKPYATYEKGVTRDILATLSVDGHNMYKFRGGDGEIYYIAARDDLLTVQDKEVVELQNKEEKRMEENIFIANGSIDVNNSLKALKRVGGALKFRDEDEEVFAEKYVYVAGGGADGIKVGHGGLVDLSNETDEKTSANLDEYFNLI